MLSLAATVLRRLLLFFLLFFPPSCRTNYVMWYPYEKNGTAVAGVENIRFRYSLNFS
jgi:hypothetical protein